MTGEDRTARRRWRRVVSLVAAVAAVGIVGAGILVRQASWESDMARSGSGGLADVNTRQAPAPPPVSPGASAPVRQQIPRKEIAARSRVAGGVISGVPGGVLGGLPHANVLHAAAPPAPAVASAEIAGSVDSFRPFDESGFLPVEGNPLSTFSIDVDTASYALVRRFIVEGSLPPSDAVRIEEMINYFPYDDPPPTGPDPFSVQVEVAACPWEPAHRLARIGLKAAPVSRESAPGSNLVFLLDVSGSMDAPDKLPLVVSSLSMLAGQLDARDEIAIVVYAGASGLVLPPTSGADKDRILEALGRLRAGGGTNGGEGLQLAYRIARERFRAGGINRVILATDGDFNLGITGKGELMRFVQEQAKAGVALTVLGFGMGNYKDDLLELLADRGDGNYGYIDTPLEARKVLVEQIGGTLHTVARDVKIQVELNPALVSAWRLIGYENRLLRAEDFNDDRKDAGEIGAGHTVTALYEIVPPGAAVTLPPPVDALRYQPAVSGPSTPAGEAGGELLTVKVRWKDPGSETSRLMTVPVTDDGAGMDDATGDLRFAAAVAVFGMVLRDSPHKGEGSLDLARELAAEGLGGDAGGHRAAFLELLGLAGPLARR